MAAKTSHDSHIKTNMAKEASKNNSAKATPTRIEKPLTAFFKPKATPEKPMPASKRPESPAVPSKLSSKLAQEDVEMVETTPAAQEETHLPKTKGVCAKKAKKPKVPT